MSVSQLSPSALSEMIGERLKQYRLNNNKSHEQLVEITGLTRHKISQAEKGKATLETFMAILIALDATDQLSLFLPPTVVSPIQLAKLQGKKRRRASHPRTHESDKDEEDLGW